MNYPPILQTMHYYVTYSTLHVLAQLYGLGRSMQIDYIAIVCSHAFLHECMHILCTGIL